ncbi:MAG: hypothetical protein NT069_27450, partial [Planctomycetota bacterium]|nr:hypothetical protein [Planctomycetota bacterium]
QAGRAILRGAIAEMETGEGKTLTATLPLLLHGLRGRAWLATANDYLARRDADWMRPIFASFGLRVGCVQGGQTRSQRRMAYDCEVVYGTLREFGFDFLKDRLSERVPADRRGDDDRPLQSPPSLLLLDEADSLLIDEAVTPLIISRSDLPPKSAELACFRFSAEIARELRIGEEFVRDPRSGTYQLTLAGRYRVMEARMPTEINTLPLPEILHSVERAIRSRETMRRDVQYVVSDGKVQIIDEGTGRIGDDRKWQAGLHQAVEAQEGVKITGLTQASARITVQDFVRRFDRIAGMTGTALECTVELRGVYGLAVERIPTRVPSQRKILPPLVYDSLDEKWQEVVAQARRECDRGRAVLIGTRTVDASEQLSARLRQAGVEHELLNALQPEREADIIAQAGGSGRVTVATNMAGRGTDIQLDPSVREAGGLHVIGTELHSSSRIDRQLAGRCGRQGDPGTFQQCVSYEDPILRLDERRTRRTSREKAHPTAASFAEFQRVQRVLERKERQSRVSLMLMEEERRERYGVLGFDPLLDLFPE